MKHDVINMNSHISNQGLNMQIAKQCAPLLTGIKISNILITSSSNKEKVMEIFCNSSIWYKEIYRENGRTTFFLYNPKKLMEYLQRPEIKRLMSALGYKNIDIESVLEVFSSRFCEYMRERELFPHEMGLLLGYPIADVVGFIEQKGKNSLYSGYWKVYSDLQGAHNTFDQYRSAKETVMQLVTEGISIKRIVMLYHTANNISDLHQLFAV